MRKIILAIILLLMICGLGHGRMYFVGEELIDVNEPNVLPPVLPLPGGCGG